MRKRRESDGVGMKMARRFGDKNKASVREPSVNDEIRQQLAKENPNDGGQRSGGGCEVEGE